MSLQTTKSKLMFFAIKIIFCSEVICMLLKQCSVESEKCMSE